MKDEAKIRNEEKKGEGGVKRTNKKTTEIKGEENESRRA